MGIFKKQYQVKSNTIGFLYRDNTFERKLTSGYHEVWDRKTGQNCSYYPKLQNF